MVIPKSEFRNPKSEMVIPKSEMPIPKSKIRNVHSEIRIPKSEMKILTVFGTRPEAIKMAPVIRELQRRSAVHRPRSADCGLRSLVCVTAQHRQMLDQVLRLFGITPNYDLNIMEDNQSPTQVAAAVLARLEPILQKERPDWVLVQGDTTTVAAASLAAFYAGVKVGHVEAGLRTHDKWRPFPEACTERSRSEINRQVARLSTLSTQGESHHDRRR